MKIEFDSYKRIIMILPCVGVVWDKESGILFLSIQIGFLCYGISITFSIGKGEKK